MHVHVVHVHAHVHVKSFQSVHNHSVSLQQRTLNPAAVDTTGDDPPIDLGLVEGVVLGESSLPPPSCCIDSTPKDVPATGEMRWPVDSTGFHRTWPDEVAVSEEERGSSIFLIVI